MSISIASSAVSLRAIGSLNKTTDELSDTFEKLSSGLRINKASDDPAGLAVADSLRADAALASVAVQNTNDGISITSIADAALDEVANILTRMAELAEQSASGSYTNVQRSALSSEFLALGSEIERIAATTEFNDSTLLSNSSSISIQVGIDNTANSVITINGVLGTLSSLGLSSGGSSQLTVSINDTTTAFAQTAATAALAAVEAAMDSLSITRGQVGAAESRLSQALSYVQVMRENFVAAESRIRDLDIAQEVAKLVRLQVLQQSGTAILAQANQQPGVVLGLLQ